MIKLLRNPEVKSTFIIIILFTAVVTFAAFARNIGFGVFVLGICIVFITIYLVTTYSRYKRISDLASDIDHILHEDTHIAIDEYSEGELGILQSEVSKMTIRLREQQQRLQNEKIYLANSIADISHQIRTPLTSINLLVSLVSEPNISENRRQKLSHDLYDLLSRIDWLITTLLKISKLDAGTVKFAKEKIPLAQLINKAISPLLVPMELRNQTFTVRTVGEIVCDVAWTSEAIINIVKNCMEHTPENGEIEIRAEDNAIYTEIVIADNGIGISKEDLPHIFERFYKGKNTDDKGFGIGLALSRMIITAQNGTVKAENGKKAGAEFTIKFYKGIV